MPFRMHKCSGEPATPPTKPACVASPLAGIGIFQILAPWLPVLHLTGFPTFRSLTKHNCNKPCSSYLWVFASDYSFALKAEDSHP